ncbi:hypothetical protein PsYK624_169140 [Phanerochaete sordida]|uniref:BTB domain-containing protein n=1 Tax=Phanerochaete sordida TaxID=48140 RepID=A0A9P3GU06_9APHY|nr:hypothetical protein PsYK624_169140 [Phanerochaete sordida]
MVNPIPIHDDKFYFADGDLVLRSLPSSEGKVTLFRPHQTTMAYSSPVFSGMLGIPGEQEMYDGAPVVDLGDTAEELRALLDALHDPSAITVSRWDPNAPLILTPLMRVASKYMADAIRERIIALLEEGCPRTFEQWVRFSAEQRALEQLYATSPDPFNDGTGLSDRVPEPAALVRFACDFDVPTLLPFAFYTLASIPAARTWTRPAGSPRVASRRYARWELLDAGELARVLRGRETLSYIRENSKQWADYYFSAPTFLCIVPQHRRACSERVLEVEDQWLQHIARKPMHTGCPDPLRIFEDAYYDAQAWKLCDDCTGKMRKWIREEQQRDIWDSLQDTFDL